jgi:glycosyltransferase involved in cell wall biosynthesis
MSEIETPVPSVEPLVSFIVPAYNVESYVRRAIDSALAQNYQKIEVIVVDDGSTDGTWALLNQCFADHPRVILIQQANTGPSAARNRAVYEAKGAYVHFLDADEFLLPTKVQRSLALFRQHPEAAVVYGHGIPLQPDGVTEIPIALPPLPSGWILCEWLTGTMAGGTNGVTSSVMAKREAVIEVGGFREDQRVAEDWDLWLRLAARYPFAALDEPLVYYHRLPQGLHANRLTMARGRLQTVQQARDYKGRERCLDEAAYTLLLASRWHVVGERAWEAGERSEARRAFLQADALEASIARKLFAVLSLFAPASTMAWTARIKSTIRSTTSN